MTNHNDSGLTRRTLLKSVGVAAVVTASGLGAGPIYAKQRSVRVSNFGGFFEKAFKQHVYPQFTKATGIEVVSLSQSAHSQFLMQLDQANKAGAAPMDVCCAEKADVLRGQAQGLWKPIDRTKLSNIKNIKPAYLSESSTGLDGVGAMGWYMTFVTNTDEISPAPHSWKALWENHPQAWGLQGGGASVLLEITAATFFGGTAILDTKDGLDKVLAKIAELKPNAKLWWQEEGTMQTALQNDEVQGGLYFHDVAMIMKKEGGKINSTFPVEGAVQGFNSWCMPSSGSATDEALEFINWACSPECHQLIARDVGAAPLIDHSLLNLTPEEFAAVSSESTPIYVAAAAKVKHADYLAQQFLKMVTA